MRLDPPSHTPDWQALQLQALDPELLRRYWVGDASPEDMSQVETWLAEAPGRRAWYDQLKRGLSAHAVADLSDEEIHRRTSAVLETVQAQAALTPLCVLKGHIKTTRGTRPYTRSSPRRTFQSWLWPIGITALMLVVTVAAWNAGARYLSQREAASTLTYTTGNGQRATITLPDGSIVTLNVASRLDVPADYAAGHRTVTLTGEGLFTVTRHQEAPFTVVTKATTARVLGTTFLVRDYVTDTAATVAVRDGKVAVHSVVLTANQQLQSNQHGLIQLGQVDPSTFTFASGVLSFDGVPLRDAIVMLDRWYDTDIRLGDPSLNSRQVAGGFTAGSLSNLTESLELMFNVRVVRDGRVLTLYPR